MKAQAEIETELVLVGGGHAHALVLRRLGMRPRSERIRITLISPDSHTPYSGMLPGMVAGHYRFEETHIDLARLCEWAGVRFITAAVTGIDPGARRLQVAGRPDVRYDIVSLDIGSQPDLDSVPGAREHAVPVKPVAGLWSRWQAFAEAPRGQQHRVAVVGGGAGGIELALAMAHVLRNRAVRIQVYGGSQILRGYNARSRAAATRALAAAGVEVCVGVRVAEVRADVLLLDDGTQDPVDTVFWCTAATPARWMADSGLATDERGFLAVRDTLQSLDDPRVFAAGDIATQVRHPRPKAGVFAVRQAPVLAHNLEAACRDPQAPRGLRAYKPQRRFLSLVSLGDKVAIADRGFLGATGAWVWRWKDHIDREFMQRFSGLPPRRPMRADQPEDATQPHCGGCGAKLGSDPLRAALASLRQLYPAACAGDADEDVAVIDTDGPVLQSIDTLRALVADPFVMGRITAQHALSDLYAAGADPHSALAHVVLPFARPSIQQADLEPLLAGALSEFSQVGCRLLGGHTLQGSELQLGFVVNGRVPAGGRRFKHGGQPGNALILTKPLGTGVLFAAHMQWRADGRDIAAAIRSMQAGNAPASRVARQAGATSATDVTGFGLLGHLAEMLGAGVGADLWLDAVPWLPGAQQAAREGIHSTLWPANRAALAGRLVVDPALAAVPEVELLFDPQTSGGLLFSVPAGAAATCLQALQDSGHQAACIGVLREDAGQRIHLRAARA